MQEFIDFAQSLALESGTLIMEHFEALRRGEGPAVLQKADLSPVTEADRGAEALMRERIAARYPEHEVLGEEYGSSGPPDAAFRWVLDPIDGTKAFVHGVPLFGTLIALLRDGVPVLGVIHLPATAELMVGAQGRPTTVNGRAVRVRPTADLAQATVLYTDVGEVQRQGHGGLFAALAKGPTLQRGWGDCYGYFLVASGRADVMFDPHLSLWDLAALKPCVEGAGGRFTDKAGRDTGLGESALASNGLLHDQMLALING